MITLATITRQIASQAMLLTRGEATGGSTTTLVDTTNLTHPKGTFDKGVLWITGGDNAGVVVEVTKFMSNTLTFDALSNAVAAGDTYVVAKPFISWEEMRRAVNDALEDFLVETENNGNLTGDGETLEFTLPTGVYNVTGVRFRDPDDAEPRYKSSHWQEIGSKLRFDNGYPPTDGYELYLTYHVPHSELTAYDDEINREVNPVWLKRRAAVLLLHRLYREYGDDERFSIPTDIEKTYKETERHRPRRKPIITVHTA